MKHPYSIAVDDQSVYWDDWQTGALYKIKKTFHKKDLQVLVHPESTGTGKKRRFEVKVYYKKTQTGTPNVLKYYGVDAASN